MTDLWSFAQRLYACPGVEAACLRLQEDGADVCLLLCAAWLERRDVACLAPRVEALRSLAEPWQRDVIAPLRGLRREWKTPAQHDAQLAVLRERLKALELHAERTLLQRLQDAASDWPGAPRQSPMTWLIALGGEHADQAALNCLHQGAGTVTLAPGVAPGATEEGEGNRRARE